ncbi:MAG: hypothetical protein MJ161_05835 [Clostridia bacterium]|nr:hypothetical protein [Clostridia bacterium]
MKKAKAIFGILAAMTLCLAFAGCGADDTSSDADKGDKVEAKTLHVAVDGSDEKGDGSEANPFATVDGILNADGLVGPGTEIVVHEGTYEPIEIFTNASGTLENPVAIRAATDEKVVIKSATGDVQNGDGDLIEAYGIHMLNVSNVVVKGFEIEGGTHGVLYESTNENGEESLDNISIENCFIHDVVGTHGIAVYAQNTYTPVTNLSILGNEVCDCLCGDSESVVVNGNVDGFTIAENIIHDNNNIGIDMIGFEGTAKKEKGEAGNLYAVDFARNGECHDNVVYNISAEGNPAYYWEGEYDLCADGIYVDGGQDINIYNNFVFNCDIGLEVATEHSPDKNELFKVSGISVHDNVVADCTGWCGLCFGGYDRDLGFTENCQFTNNTFVDNETQVGVQRSSGNLIEGNLFVGESSTIEFNYDCREADIVNDFGANTWCIPEGTLEDYMDYGDYDLSKLMIMGALEKQEVILDRNEVIDGFASKVAGAGSEFVPDDEFVELYKKNKEAK